MLYAIILVLVAAVVTVSLLWKGERDERRNRDIELRRVDAAFIEFKKKYEPVVNAEAERDRILEHAESVKSNAKQKADETVAQAEQTRQDILNSAEDASRKLDDLKSRLNSLQAELRPLDEEANLRSFGLYKPHYDFADSERYERKLDEIREKQKEMLKTKTAAVADREWMVDGSVTEGRKQINQTIKLMLRAFNGECDAAITKVKYNNVKVMEARIEKAFEAINGLAEVQQCRITREYLNLKLQELYLAHEYQEKVQAEKEEQRRIREQMREEEIAQRELEKAKKEAEDEERRYEEALLKAREDVGLYGTGTGNGRKTSR